MYKPKLDKDIRCPLEYAMNVFGGKWKTRIICVVGRNKNIRYGEIKKQMTNITDTVLAATLKELVNDGIVERIQYNEIPPRVEYNLTKNGRSILPILFKICEWSDYVYHDELDYDSVCCKCDYKRDRDMALAQKELDAKAL